MLGLFPHLDPYDRPPRKSLLARLRQAWQGSPRFRLLALGLTLLLIAFPLVSVVVAGG